MMGNVIFLLSYSVHTLSCGYIPILCNIYRRFCKIQVTDVALPLVVSDEFLASDDVFASVTAFPCEVEWWGDVCPGPARSLLRIKITYDGIVKISNHTSYTYSYSIL